ncbi:MAG: hypothetical protein H6622_01675 [Halobacteriovoraceae bacterium]|nr:hypothetical protein [Halobacteriovoraceae bacterium]
MFKIIGLMLYSTLSLNLLGQVAKLNPNAWEKVYSKDRIEVYSQKTDQSKLLAFKAIGLIKGDTGQMMEILRNVEDSHTWMPNLIDKKTIKNISDFEAITYSVNNMPWPLKDREMIHHNKLTINYKRKFLEVDVHSVEYETDMSSDKNIRAFMHFGRTLVRPSKTDGYTEVELIVLVEPMGLIPSWLVNFVQKDLPFEFLKALEKKAQHSNYKVRPSFQKLLEELKSISHQQSSVGLKSFKVNQVENI